MCILLYYWANKMMMMMMMKLYGVCRVQFHSARKTRLRTADRLVSSVDRARAPESVIVRDTTRAREAGVCAVISTAHRAPTARPIGVAATHRRTCAGYLTAALQWRNSDVTAAAAARASCSEHRGRTDGGDWRDPPRSVNQLFSGFLQWPKWCNHCKDH